MELHTLVLIFKGQRRRNCASASAWFQKYCFRRSLTTRFRQLRGGVDFAGLEEDGKFALLERQASIFFHFAFEYQAIIFLMRWQRQLTSGWQRVVPSADVLLGRQPTPLPLGTRFSFNRRWETCQDHKTDFGKIFQLLRQVNYLLF